MSAFGKSEQTFITARSVATKEIAVAPSSAPPEELDLNALLSIDTSNLVTLDTLEDRLRQMDLVGLLEELGVGGSDITVSGNNKLVVTDSTGKLVTSNLDISQLEAAIGSAAALDSNDTQFRSSAGSIQRQLDLKEGATNFPDSVDAIMVVGSDGEPTPSAEIALNHVKMLTGISEGSKILSTNSDGDKLETTAVAVADLVDVIDNFATKQSKITFTAEEQSNILMADETNGVVSSSFSTDLLTGLDGSSTIVELLDTKQPKLNPTSAEKVLVSTADGAEVSAVTKTQLEQLPQKVSNIEDIFSALPPSFDSDNIVFTNGSGKLYTSGNSNIASFVQSVDVTTPSDKQVLSYSGSNWSNSDLGSLIQGGASTVVSSNLTGAKCLVSNASGKITTSAVDSSKLATFIDANVSTLTNYTKTDDLNPIATSAALTSGKVLVTNGSGNITAGNLDSSLLAHLSSVTSDIQSQLDLKLEADAIANIPSSSALNLKADKATTYTKTEVDTSLEAKADSSSTYNKTDVDGLLGQKANSADVYTKTQVDTSLASKANQSTTYTKAATDDLLADKADTSSIYTRTDVDSKLDLKASLAGCTFTGAVEGITKAMVGLANVNNTSDADKPISDATAVALATKLTAADIADIPTSATLDLKANSADVYTKTVTDGLLNQKASLAGCTFTGTVNGISKNMVGLGNVNNTSDLSKPVSTAVTAALGAKASLSGCTFTGTVNGITKGMVGLGNVDNTSDLNKPVSTAVTTALGAKANSADVYTKTQVYTKAEVNSELDLKQPKIAADNKLPYEHVSGIVHNTLAELPDASEHHGKIAHVHGEGSLYFGHANAWEKLAKQSSLDLKADASVVATKADVSSVMTDSMFPPIRLPYNNAASTYQLSWYDQANYVVTMPYEIGGTVYANIIYSSPLSSLSDGQWTQSAALAFMDGGTRYNFSMGNPWSVLGNQTQARAWFDSPTTNKSLFVGLDALEEKTWSEVRVGFQDANNGAAAFIDTSSDGSNWQEIASFTVQGWPGGASEMVADPHPTINDPTSEGGSDYQKIPVSGTGRYIRVRVNAANVTGDFSLYLLAFVHGLPLKEEVASVKSTINMLSLSGAQNGQSLIYDDTVAQFVPGNASVGGGGGVGATPASNDLYNMLRLAAYQQTWDAGGIEPYGWSIAALLAPPNGWIDNSWIGGTTLLTAGTTFMHFPDDNNSETIYDMGTTNNIAYANFWKANPSISGQYTHLLMGIKFARRTGNWSDTTGGMNVRLIFTSDDTPVEWTLKVADVLYVSGNKSQEGKGANANTYGNNISAKGGIQYLFVRWELSGNNFDVTGMSYAGSPYKLYNSTENNYYRHLLDGQLNGTSAPVGRDDFLNWCSSSSKKVKVTYGTSPRPHGADGTGGMLIDGFCVTALKI